MESLHKTVFDNFHLVIIFAVVWNILGIGFLIWKRKRRGIVFPKLTDSTVKFSERFASGSSNKSWKTRLGGASNCLTVMVTESHFVVTTFFPFTAFVEIYDLEHLIPLSQITDVSPKGGVTKINLQTQ